MKNSLVAIGVVGLAVGLFLFQTTTREGFAQYEQKCPDGSKPRWRMIFSNKPPEFYCSSGVAGEKVCPASHPFPYKDDFERNMCASTEGGRDGQFPVCPAGSTEVTNESTDNRQCEKITPIRCSDGGMLMITLMPGKGFGQKDAIDKVLCVPANLSYDPTPEDMEKVRATNPPDLTKLCKKREDVFAMDMSTFKTKCIPPVVAPPPPPPVVAPTAPTAAPPVARVSAPAVVRNAPISELGPTSGIRDLLDSLIPFRPPTAPSSDLEIERKAILAITQKDMFFIQIALFLSVLSMLGYLVLPTEYAHGIALLLLTVAISFGFFLRR
jgi:hypothetical protein